MGENFRRKLKLAAVIEQMASRMGMTAAQLALAWVLAQGDDIAPIPAPPSFMAERKRPRGNNQADARRAAGNRKGAAVSRRRTLQ